jgi:hypothetical protein
MQSIIIILCIFLGQNVLGATFPNRAKLCTYPLDSDDGKFLLFNFKTRSEVKIKLDMQEARKLQKGPYLFELEILNPEYRQKEYRAKIRSFSSCKAQEVVRFVDGELNERK